MKKKYIYISLYPEILAIFESKYHYIYFTHLFHRHGDYWLRHICQTKITSKAWSHTCSQANNLWHLPKHSTDRFMILSEFTSSPLHPFSFQAVLGNIPSCFSSRFNNYMKHEHIPGPTHFPSIYLEAFIAIHMPWIIHQNFKHFCCSVRLYAL